MASEGQTTTENEYKKNLKCDRGSDNCDDENFCESYEQGLRCEYQRTLQVSAVFDPATATRQNSPMIFVEDGEVKGASVDLLKKAVSSMPGIKKINIIPKANAEDALEDLIVGTTSLDITPMQVTRHTLLNQLSAVAIDIGSSGVINNQLLFYANTDPCAANSDSVFTFANTYPASLILSTVAVNSLTAAAVYNIYLSVDNVSGIDAVNNANANAGVSYVGGLKTLPLATYSTITELINSIKALIGSDCYTMVMVPNTFTSDEFAALLAAFPPKDPTVPQPGIQFSIVPLEPDEISLARGWHYLKFACHFGLYLQREVDRAAADGSYHKILEKYGLTTQTKPADSLVSPVCIPPSYYSLQNGLIPRVCVVDAYLPKLSRCCDSHSVEVVLTVDEQDRVA